MLSHVGSGDAVTLVPVSQMLTTQQAADNLDGSDPASPPQPNLGTGSRGWFATIAALLRLGTATRANSASVTIATDQGNLEPGGTAITGAAMPAGGVGLTGWLSALWSALKTSIVYSEFAASAVTSGTAVNSNVRDSGADFGAPSNFGKVKCFLSSTAAGTLTIFGSSSPTGANPI